MVSPTNDTAYVVMASHNNIPDHERRGEQGGERLGDGVPVVKEPSTTIPKPPGQYQHQHQQHNGSTSPTTTTMAADSREPLQCCDLRWLLIVLNLVLLAVVCLLLDKDQDFLDIGYLVLAILSGWNLFILLAMMHGWFWWKHSEDARENPTPMNLSI